MNSLYRFFETIQIGINAIYRDLTNPSTNYRLKRPVYGKADRERGFRLMRRAERLSKSLQVLRKFYLFRYFPKQPPHAYSLRFKYLEQQIREMTKEYRELGRYE